MPNDIEKLPFDLQSWETFKEHFTLEKSLKTTTSADHEARCRLFYRLQECGLANQCAFIVIKKDGEQVQYTVVNVDTVYFEYKAIRYDMLNPGRVIYPVREIINGSIVEIIGHLKSDKFSL